MSLLTLIQYMCGRTGVPVPSTVYGTTDTQVLQMMRLLEEEGNDLSQRGTWQGLTFEASLTTAATEDQGAITSIATNGFRYIKNQTIWSRTRRLPVCGPLDPQEWQMLKALYVEGPYYRFRIRGGKLLVNPAPPVESWYFEYVSKNWLTDSTGVTYRQYFANDADITLLPEELLLTGLRWRWKKEKGLDYAEDFRTYEHQVKDALGRDGGKPILYMDESKSTAPTPGIFVPSGSWNL